MKKIILTAVNAKYIHSNLAVYSLRAYAAKCGIPTELAEYTINQTKGDILASIYRKQPDVLCFSCYIWNISFVKELIADLHKVLPCTPIWVGGPEVSFDAHKVLSENPGIFGVMRAEGEATFAELAAWYAREGTVCKKEHLRELKTIAGITYREDTGEIRENPDRKMLDLSTIPFPYEDLKDFEHRIIYYESSRGCPFSCSYCLSSIDKKLRFRDLELVKKELQFFLDHNVPQVKFVDRTFNCKKEHALEIWKYLMEHDNQYTNFHFEIAADLLTQAELELFSQMRPGLIQLEIGVQSTNTKTIGEIHRKMDFERVCTLVRRIQEGKNIHQHLDLIAGLPYEDYESFASSFRKVYALHPQQLQLGFLKVLKGSYMQEHIQDYSGVYSDKEPYEILSTKWISYPELLKLKQVEEMVEVYYNSGQFCHMLVWIERSFTDMFAFFEGLGAYYEAHGYAQISLTRIRRYEILLAYLEYADPGKQTLYRELAALDVYARENAKSRPEFAADLSGFKEQIRAFYQSEEQKRTYLPAYEDYDWKQMMKMTHIEIVGEIHGKPEAYLFDYKNRDVLTGSAGMQRLDEDFFTIRTGKDEV